MCVVQLVVRGMMVPPLRLDMIVQPGSSRCHPGCPCPAVGLHSADRSAATLLLVVIEEWWCGHPPAPVKIPCFIITTTHCIYTCIHMMMYITRICKYIYMYIHWALLSGLRELKKTIHVIFKTGWDVARL